jgi:uncharacterized membrane protein YfcA
VPIISYPNHGVLMKIFDYALLAIFGLVGGIIAFLLNIHIDSQWKIPFGGALGILFFYLFNHLSKK